MAEIHITACVTRIVAAYVRRHRIGRNDAIGLIETVAAAMVEVTSPAPQLGVQTKLSARAIAVSVRPDYIVSFENGRRYKSLTRHLSSIGLSPDGYRRKWGLPFDYPMTAPQYSAVRSRIAKVNSLGSKQQRGLSDATVESGGGARESGQAAETSAQTMDHGAASSRER